MSSSSRPFRVLSLDGGGMRGTYTATYLACLSGIFAQRRGLSSLDLGAAFDLIVGTSTGGIIAVCLAANVPLDRVVDVYRNHGRDVFRRPLPYGRFSLLKLIVDLSNRRADLRLGSEAFETALHDELGDMTLGQLYAKRGIALAITAVELSQHRSWIFKTPHFEGTTHRDDDYRLVDVCLATSAAPVYRSLAAIDHPDSGHHDGYNVFADGGLWANNPVLVSLLEALEIAAAEQKIEIFCIGTCPLPAGEQIHRSDIHRGLAEWKFGGAAASLSIDAQEFAYDNMARKFVRHLNRQCEVIRFPREQVPAALMPYLELDDVREEATQALINQARQDAQMTMSRCADPACRETPLICSLFENAPVQELPAEDILKGTSGAL